MNWPRLEPSTTIIQGHNGTDVVTSLIIKCKSSGYVTLFSCMATDVSKIPCLRNVGILFPDECDGVTQAAPPVKVLPCRPRHCCRCAVSQVPLNSVLRILDLLLTSHVGSGGSRVRRDTRSVERGAPSAGNTTPGQPGMNHGSLA
jgi:hypothetical protein